MYILPLIDPCHAGTEGIVLVVLQNIDRQLFAPLASLPYREAEHVDLSASSSCQHGQKYVRLLGYVRQRAYVVWSPTDITLTDANHRNFKR